VRRARDLDTSGSILFFLHECDLGSSCDIVCATCTQYLDDFCGIVFWLPKYDLGASVGIVFFPPPNDHDTFDNVSYSLCEDGHDDFRGIVYLAPKCDLDAFRGIGDRLRVFSPD
jgi:hypothetical protein